MIVADVFRFAKALIGRLDAISQMPLSADQLTMLMYLDANEVNGEWLPVESWVRFGLLAKLTGLGESAAGHQLRRLVALRLCRKTKNSRLAGGRDCDDKRAVWYSLTFKGRRFCAEYAEEFKAIERLMRSGAYGFKTQQPAHWIRGLTKLLEEAALNEPATGKRRLEGPPGRRRRKKPKSSR